MRRTIEASTPVRLGLERGATPGLGTVGGECEANQTDELTKLFGEYTAMGIHKWLGRERRQHGKGRAERRADRCRRVLGLEGLEDRQLLSTITWTNRGQPSDGFDAEFGG